jgi:hypothetical protein
MQKKGIVICLWLGFLLIFKVPVNFQGKLYIKMHQQLFHWLRNAKQLNIRNETKVNNIQYLGFLGTQRHIILCRFPQYINAP